MTKEIMQIQLALFFKSDFLGNYEDISLKLKNKLSGNKITQYIPLPQDAPGEIPRLILGFDNYKINISKNRIDIFFQDIEVAKNIISGIYEILVSQGILFCRIGFVKNFFTDGDIDNLKGVLVEAKITGKHIKELSIRVNEEWTVKGYLCNNMETISNGSMTKNEKNGESIKKNGIIIARDINTLAEKINDYNFDLSKIIELSMDFDRESNNSILL